MLLSLLFFTRRGWCETEDVTLPLSEVTSKLGRCRNVGIVDETGAGTKVCRSAGPVDGRGLLDLESRSILLRASLSSDRVDTSAGLTGLVGSAPPTKLKPTKAQASSTCLDRLHSQDRPKTAALRVRLSTTNRSGRCAGGCAIASALCNSMIAA